MQCTTHIFGDICLSTRVCDDNFVIETHLHGDESVIHHDFFCKKIGAYGRFVLIAEFLVHILVH